jgi:hypothetical protein
VETITSVGQRGSWKKFKKILKDKKFYKLFYRLLEGLLGGCMRVFEEKIEFLPELLHIPLDPPQKNFHSLILKTKCYKIIKHIVKLKDERDDKLFLAM